MKKIASLLLAVLLIVTAFASCSFADDTKIRVGYMSGPTGMGMAKLINDNGGAEAGNEKYSFTSFDDTKAATAKLTANEVDIICIPTNEAAKYFEIDSELRILALNCFNSLFVITNEDNTVSNFAELEGKTIYTCQNGTPKVILDYVLAESGINATVSTSYDGKVMATPKELAAQVIAGKLPIAVIPEPIVTQATTQAKANNNVIYTVDVDLGDVVDEKIAMGCIVARDRFIKQHKTLINSFLEEYETSIEYIANPENVQTSATYVADAKIMGAAPLASKAILNLGDAIGYADGDEMKTILVKFYENIGLTLPADEIYYKK